MGRICNFKTRCVRGGYGDDFKKCVLVQVLLHPPRTCPTPTPIFDVFCHSDLATVQQKSWYAPWGLFCLLGANSRRSNVLLISWGHLLGFKGAFEPGYTPCLRLPSSARHPEVELSRVDQAYPQKKEKRKRMSRRLSYGLHVSDLGTCLVVGPPICFNSLHVSGLK